MSIMKKPQPKTPASKSTSITSVASKKSVSTKSLRGKGKPPQKKKKGCFGCCRKKHDAKKQSSKKSATKSPRPSVPTRPQPIRPSYATKSGGNRPPAAVDHSKLAKPMAVGAQLFQASTQPTVQTTPPVVQPVAQSQVPALAQPFIARQPVGVKDNKPSPKDTPVKSTSSVNENVTPKVKKMGIESELTIRNFERDQRFHRSFFYTVSFPLPKPKVQKKKKSMVTKTGREITPISRHQKKQKGKCKCAPKFRRILSVVKQQTGDGKVDTETGNLLKQMEVLLDKLQHKINEN
ncbi:hypothetical protein M3Y98_01045200 [Aphelenchoides besseyi]|nr:hypothetical protein M3Y98_01045200 [Aphelenchoides besseyi]KAI6209839.1 hypothetical protein M3Y96_00263700 [Aphelenchoides besseyi]